MQTLSALLTEGEKMNKILLFSTPKYKYLADKIYNEQFFEYGEIEIKKFPDGERYQRIISEVKDRNVVIISGTISDEETLTLYDLACAIAKYDAKKLTIVVPYYGYSTMERAVKYGEVVTAKTRARLLSAIPNAKDGNHFIMVDLHSEGIPFYFEGDVTSKHLYAKKVIREAALNMAERHGYNDFILASTDAGRAKWVESLANDMGVGGAFVLKRRISGTNTQVTAINADVKGKFVIIYDDMIRTGGSLIHAAQAYKDAGAENIAVISTHGLFPDGAVKKLRDSGLFSEIIVTDTHPNALMYESEFLKTVSVSELIRSELME